MVIDPTKGHGLGLPRQLLGADPQGTGSRLTLPGIDPAARRAMEASLGQNQPVSLLYFAIDNFHFFRGLYGEDVGDRILRTVDQELRTLLADAPGGLPCHIEEIDAGAFICLRADPDLDHDSLPDAAATIRLGLKSRLKQESLRLTGQTLDLHAGYALIESLSRGGLEHALYNALCDAQRLARGNLDPSQLKLLKEFRAIIDTPLLSSVFQPIVDFQTGGVMAWEALSRGPAGHSLHSPASLFDFAEEIGQIFALEKACRETAVRTVGPLAPGQKLFLNIHPRTMVDPSFSPGETLRLLSACGLTPANIVFEITERHRIRDFTLFHRTLEHYRGQGFQVAVDDVGTGYSGLWSIAELKPDYLKVDMSLVRGIDENPVKRALLETFVDFAERIGCRLIAEGIETKTELSCLVGLGVHCGQGYYLARPAFPKPLPGVRVAPALGVPSLTGRDLKCSIPVRDLARAAHELPPSARVCEVKERMQGTDAVTAFVVCEEGRPLGLVMSHHMDRALSTRYGLSLYFQRSITRIMDPSPLVVDGGMAVQTVARLAMNRDKYKIYDHIVVTEKGILSGIVSVQTLIDTLAAVQVEMAKGANPLSGLPGNVAIEQEIEKRSRKGEPFSIVYADLDNFKIYNDTYGFHSGDKVLLLFSRILTWAFKRHGQPSEDFVGHVGGDDFVAICSPQRAERVCRAVTRCFGRLVRGCYNETDRCRGFITAKSRSGQIADFPLVSVSLAIVDCLGPCDLEALARRSAEMKKYAKTIEGNSYVHDRRAALGGPDGERC
jgi:EAL domain-containing protein (putative c-di-GMP-specific phosphodiesterase class I)/GGDEF domain-containing protein